MPFDQGAPSFGLNDGKIANWITTAGVTSYGTLTDIMSIQMANVSVETVNAILVGDDRQTAIMALAIGGTLQLRFGGMNTSSLAVLLGKAMTTVTGVNQIQISGGHKFPYLGGAFKALSAEIGDTWLWIPKFKIMSGFTLQMEYGAFSIPEVTCQVVDDDNWGIVNIVTHPTDLPITVFPPANIAEVA